MNDPKMKAAPLEMKTDKHMNKAIVNRTVPISPKRNSNDVPVGFSFFVLQ